MSVLSHFIYKSCIEKWKWEKNIQKLKRVWSQSQSFIFIFAFNVPCRFPSKHFAGKIKLCKTHSFIYEYLDFDYTFDAHQQWDCFSIHFTIALHQRSKLKLQPFSLTKLKFHSIRTCSVNCFQFAITKAFVCFEVHLVPKKYFKQFLDE